MLGSFFLKITSADFLIYCWLWMHSMAWVWESVLNTRQVQDYLNC